MSTSDPHPAAEPSAPAVGSSIPPLSVEPVPAPRLPLAPVSSRERIVILDVLRGIALFGVAIANVWLWFSGIFFLFPDYQAEVTRLSLDAVVFNGIGLVVSGKAATTFAFLFGLGFALQMVRAERLGASGLAAYRRRLAVLLCIGLAHAFFLWYGDILTAYAALGFALILFRRRSDRTVLVWAGICTVAIPLAVGALPLLMSVFGEGMPAPDPDGPMAELRASALAAFQGGSYGEMVSSNARMVAMMYLSPKAFWLFFVLGTFLLGLYAGRRRFFENVEAHRAGFRRLAVWGLAVGLVVSSGMLALRILVPEEALFADPRLILLLTALSIAGTFPLAFGYIATATLLWQRAAWRPVLGAFAPVGRMALTNYLMQTILFLAIFYGVGGGLIGRIGSAAALAITLAVFALQMLWSPWWLARFRFGPMEWLWRSITYREIQPMRAGEGGSVPVGAGIPPSGNGR